MVMMMMVMAMAILMSDGANTENRGQRTELGKSEVKITPGERNKIIIGICYCRGT